MTNTETNEEEFVPVDDDIAVIFTNGSITDSATLGDFETPAPEIWITGQHPVYGKKPANVSIM